MYFVSVILDDKRECRLPRLVYQTEVSVLVSQVSGQSWLCVRCQEVTAISYWIGNRFSFSGDAKNKARKSGHLFIHIVSSSYILSLH